ncbi:MAG: Fur family transcriptional regulator [Candidatus Onthomonas sp.]
MTRYGRVILSCLRRAEGHLTAEQIFFLVKQEEPGIALATVYNNLNRLCQEGELRRISVAGQTDRYDETVKPHGHLVCDRCGSITDVPLPELLPELEQRLHTPISAYELNLHYLCPDCRSTEKEKENNP